MDDPTTRAIDLLCERGHNDAARALARCSVALRHAGEVEQRRLASRPLTDVLIHAPAEVLAQIRHTSPPQGDWAFHIERALANALHPRFGVRIVQWTETEPVGAARMPAGGETRI